MLNVVTFMWQPKAGYRSKYGMKHVVTMARMIARHYQAPHRFVCFTDAVGEPASFCTDAPGERFVSLRPLWSEYASATHPHGDNNPSCYRRLKLYSNWARHTIGDRILSIDLDMVITGDVTDLWNDQTPFVFWQDQLNPHGRVNGAMQLITPGLRDDVWSGFDLAEAQRVGRERGYWGSDQGWLAHKFGPDDHGRFTAPDCVSWRVHCQPNGGALPPGAKVVNFHGPGDPWTLSESAPWIKEHYR